MSSTHFLHLSFLMYISHKVSERSACRRLSSYQHDKSKCLRMIKVPLMRVWLILSAHLMWFCRTRSPMVTLRHALPPLFYGTYRVICQVQKYHNATSCFCLLLVYLGFLYQNAMSLYRFHDIVEFFSSSEWKTLFTATSLCKCPCFYWLTSLLLGQI